MARTAQKRLDYIAEYILGEYTEFEPIAGSTSDEDLIGHTIIEPVALCLICGGCAQCPDDETVWVRQNWHVRGCKAWSTK
jgi:hypothetical protein